MALQKQFSNKLENIWRRRTAELRALVIPRGQGQPTKFTRKIRDGLVNQLLGIATDILLKRHGDSAFRAVTQIRRLWQIKGHGLLKRGENLLRWAKANLNGPVVYAFWRGRKCLYVGKGNSWKRLRSYEKSAYLKEASCIKVFFVNAKSQLGKAECLATHLFEPRDNKVNPAKAKWGKACPVCRSHDQIRSELNSLFKMK